ncbi:MAG TPA: hypothetical protein VK757_02235, partial [Candidatus Acidoferrum sp.]|nr:hypothetical protein [Candidatus Acidoferrum sp.]
MHEVDSNQSNTQRRRSERVSKSVPLIVRGIDLLGQPFEERTSTLALNLHGCRYSSKHHLPKNTWVTLEMPQMGQRRNVRARVAWIQRPHSVREFFQIAVELENAADIWGLETAPADWNLHEALPAIEEVAPQHSPRSISESDESAPPTTTTETFTERARPDMTNPFFESAAAAPFSQESASESESTAAMESPLLREWKAEIERQATHAAESASARAADSASARATEQIRQTMEELEQAQRAASGTFSSELAAKQEEILNGLKLQFEQGVAQARELAQDLDRRAQDLRAESEAAAESASRLAQARFDLDAAEASRSQQQSAEAARRAEGLSETAVSEWQQRLATEMKLAQAQWNELLQTSLDGSIERLVEELSGRAQEVLGGAEQKMQERFAELRQPLSQMYTEARDTLSGVRAALEHEVGRARSSLAEIEHAAGRMKEYSAQLEAASHDTLNELHRRLENILEAQTDEMHRRAQQAVEGVPQRLAPTLDHLGNQLVERTMAEVEAKLAPRVERVPELLRELANREVELENSLRLHRERLRQVSENSQRDVAEQIAATVGNLRNEFEGARKEALTKWSEEINASGVRASHAAAESIGKSSEWFQQEAQTRLQVLVEQALNSVGGGFEEKTSEAGRQFEARLEEQSTKHVAGVQQQLDGLAEGISNRTHSQLDHAAEAAAASFGQILRSISDEELGQFTSRSHEALEERRHELQGYSDQVVRNLDGSATELMARFQAEMAAQRDANLAQGRAALAAEFASALEGYRLERDAHDKAWADNLDRVGRETAEKYQDRLDAAGDSWIVSSVRRLNEHGQNVIESLMRSADQALRDSCAKLFEGLSEIIRDR